MVWTAYGQTMKDAPGERRGRRRDGDGLGRRRIFRHQLQVVDQHARLHVGEGHAEFGTEALLDVGELVALGNPGGDLFFLSFVQVHNFLLALFGRQNAGRFNGFRRARKFYRNEGGRVD